MASIQQVIFTRLTGSTLITGLVGSSGVFPNILPQGATVPAVTYQKVSGAVEHTMGVDAGINRPRFQVDAMASTHAAAITLATNVKSVLSRWRDTTTNPKVQDIFLENEQDLTEQEDTDDMYWRISLDFEVIHEDVT